jgi:hypothetical protein
MSTTLHHYTVKANSAAMDAFDSWMQQIGHSDPDESTVNLIAEGGPLPEPLEGLAVQTKVWVCKADPQKRLKVFKNVKTFQKHMKNCRHDRDEVNHPSEHWAQTLRTNQNAAQWFLVQQ